MSEDLNSTSEPQAQPSVWSRLSEARLARDLSLEDVAHTLKLTVKQVQAMESGDLQRLPGLAFTRGFLRNYARLLTLDPAPFLAELEPPKPDSSVPPTPPRLAIMPAARIVTRYPALPALLVTLLVFLLVTAGWYFRWFEAREELSLLETLEQTETPLANTSSPLALSSAPVAQSAPAENLAQPSSAPISPIADTSAPAAPSSAPQAVAVSGKALLLRFEQDSWVDLRDASGAELFSGLVAAGAVREWQGQPPYTLLLGNAPGVKVFLKGQAVSLPVPNKDNVVRIVLP